MTNRHFYKRHIGRFYLFFAVAGLVIVKFAVVAAHRLPMSLAVVLEL